MSRNAKSDWKENEGDQSQIKYLIVFRDDAYTSSSHCREKAKSLDFTVMHVNFGR